MAMGMPLNQSTINTLVDYIKTTLEKSGVKGNVLFDGHNIIIHIPSEYIASQIMNQIPQELKGIARVEAGDIKMIIQVM